MDHNETRRPKIMKKMLLAGLALAGFTAAYADGAYISAQAGVGGLDTKKYSAQSFPTSSDHIAVSL